MESDISGSLDQPELIISQVFELDDMFGFCQDIFGLNRSVSLSTSIIFFLPIPLIPSLASSLRKK